jgi:hypothetical protein
MPMSMKIRADSLQFLAHDERNNMVFLFEGFRQITSVDSAQVRLIIMSKKKHTKIKPRLPIEYQDIPLNRSCDT